ncbi:MAG: hypothetical protein GY719_02230 [bacterium]|nr:hypothetical protein [bacterium]
MSRKTDEASHDRREEILHEELERRLAFLEEEDDSVFGEFTTRDWVLCTLLFFVLPLLALGVMAL